jgi:hypothetical protein
VTIKGSALDFQADEPLLCPAWSARPTCRDEENRDAKKV